MDGETYTHRMGPFCQRCLWYVYFHCQDVILYAHQQQTDADGEDSDSEEDRPPKKQKPVVKLEVGEDDRPLLPDTVMDGSMIFDDLHPIVREYMTLNYSCV
jgi:hypothetical protein